MPQDDIEMESMVSRFAQAKRVVSGDRRFSFIARTAKDLARTTTEFGRASSVASVRPKIVQLWTPARPSGA